MSIKILRIESVIGANWNNLIDENGQATPSPASVRFADGFATYVRVLAESGGEAGFALYYVNDISDRVIINSVKLSGTFRAGPEVPSQVDSFIRLIVKTHGVHYWTSIGDFIVLPGQTVTTSKTWETNPYTGLPWTVSEVDMMSLYLFLYCGYYPDGEEDIKVDCDVAYFEVDYDPAIPLVTTKDETNITNSSADLNGEITDDGGGCTERGFEYYKVGEPENVVVVKETGEFGDGIFSLTAGGLEAGTKYYFRAYALNEADTGYGSWKNFVTTAVIPTVTTQGASVPVPIPNSSYEYAEGNGTIVATGGQVGVYKCKERGFEVKLEFSGSLYSHIIHSIAGFTGHAHFNFDNFKYEGTLIKTEKESGSFGEGSFSLILGSFGAFFDKLFAGESYTYRAFATNDEGTGYGEWVAFSLGPLLLIVETPGDPPDGGHLEGESTEIKWVTVQNLAGGQSGSRIGIRYGTTPSANEFDTHRDGVWGAGIYKFVLSDLTPSTKYYQVPYILVGDIGELEGLYEGPLIESETLPEDVGGGAGGPGAPSGPGGIGGPRGEFATPHFSPRGQDYREVVEKVLAEKLSIQPIIDFSGGKKTLKLVNHLIQKQDNALVIAGNYLSRFQFAKAKMVIEYATPMPFEREDTIDFDYGKIRFKADGDGIILFRADGEGLFPFWHAVSTILRKISLKMGITEKTVEYSATLELEEE